MSDSRSEGMRLSKARERADAEAKGEPWCEPADLGVAIEPGASSPHVSIGGQRAVLIFRIAQPDSSSDAVRPLARLVFHDAVAVRMGPPNDEAISGHPLWKSGLEMYQGHVVHNSAWVMESEARNRVHPLHSAERWLSLTHYLFTFHDETFECLAGSYEIERSPELCARCREPVVSSRTMLDVYEGMHWVCFHYEYEHRALDRDTACADPICPARAFDPEPPPDWFSST